MGPAHPYEDREAALAQPGHDGWCGMCHVCGEDVWSDTVSTEAFELCGELTCDECAEEIIEDNCQFGVGA